VSNLDWRYLIPALFAILAVLFGYRAWQGGTGADSRTATGRKVALRIAVIFLLVSLFLLFYL